MYIINSGKKKYSILFKRASKRVTIDDLKDLGQSDLLSITTIGSKKPNRSKAVKTFEITCKLFGEDIKDGVEFVKDYISSNLYVDDVEEYVEPEVEEHTIEVLKKIAIGDIKDVSFEELTIACVVLAAQHKALECPPLLLVVGPSGVNKTGLMRKFRDSRYVKWTGRATAKSWLPGSPNVDADRTKGIFERSNGRCIIQNEIASMRGEDNMDFILGIITDSYGPEGIVLDDGAGEVIIPTYFTTIFGMTDDMYYEWIKKSLGFGQRFLTLSMENDYGTYHSSFRRPVSMEDMRQQWISLIEKVKDSDIPEATDEMLGEAYDWCKKIMVLTSLWKATEYSKTNGGHRLADQIVTMALMKAVLCETDPTVDDVKMFFELTVKMVPYQHDWKKIINKSVNEFDKSEKFFVDKGETYNNLFKLGIFEDIGFGKWKVDEDWLEFLNEVGGMW